MTSHHWKSESLLANIKSTCNAISA